MNHRADYLLQVLEKIGSPLLASVIEVNARMHNTQLTAEAQKIAELLARTVQTGIDLGYALDLGPSGQITDSLRLAMTGLAAPLIAGSFRNNGKTPTDTDIKKIITAMQAVLSFAENFSADSDHSDRLKNLNPGDGASDAAQNYLRNVYAFVPVVNVVGAYSFGQPEQKLIMDIASRLTATARQIANARGKDADVHILNALAQIYAACHQAETAHIMGLSEQDRQKAVPPLDPVWKNFDLRVAMLEALAGGIITTSAATDVAPVMPQQNPPPAAAPPAQGAVNPLSMFAKKPDGAAPPQAPQQPPAAPPQQPQTPPPPTEPPPSGGNPMSFFKGPPKKTDE